MTGASDQIEDAELFAWLDGELSSEAAAVMDAKVAADPRLQALATTHRALAAALQSAFEPLASAPVPSRIDRLLQDRQVISLRASPRGFFLKPWFALAATLAIGFMLGRLTLGTPSVQDTGRIYASAGLQQTLDTQLASAPQASAPQHVGITFRNRDGQICRSFEDRASSGIACREAERWRLVALFPSPPAQSGGYHMAASNPQLTEVISSMINGAPLDAGQEARAKASGWR